MKEIQNGLANNLKRYIDIILEEYWDYIPEAKKEELQIKKDYTDFIEIADTKTISLFYRDNKIYFPKLAFLVLDKLKEQPNYGIDPKHKCYDEKTIIQNQNTFTDYINHAIIAGLTPEQYFQENLLHETMHFCGCGGGDPLREGLAELKTRELALKKGLLTSGCGYPKEIDIVLKLQEILGAKTMNKIAFAKNSKKISDILLQDHNPELEELYFSVKMKMQEQFHEYISQNYDGSDAPLKKSTAYEQLDYSEAYELINQYKTKKEIDKMLKEEQTFQPESSKTEKK